MQWGDFNDDDNVDCLKMKLLGMVKKMLLLEFICLFDLKLEFIWLLDGDVYVLQVGFFEGFLVVCDLVSKEEWIIYCYGIVGVVCDVVLNIGSGSLLYVIIGQVLCGLDCNLVVVGWVIEGMEYFFGLFCGVGLLGFYEKLEQCMVIVLVVLVVDLLVVQWLDVEVLCMDSWSFVVLIEVKCNCVDVFYMWLVGKIDLCSISVLIWVVVGK